MLTNNCFYPKINNLRVVLSCFYIYLVSNTFQYAKQVTFKYPFSNSKMYSNTYMLIRSFIGGFCILLYTMIIIYSLWFERVGILIYSIVLSIILLIIRSTFDIYGHYVNYLQYSLYPSFKLIIKNQTEINLDKQKQILEELIDFSMELIINIIGILLTILFIIRMIRKKWKRRRQMELEILRINEQRRKTL